MKLRSNVEQELWASVFASEFSALRARAAACYVPGQGESGNFRYGSAVDGNACTDMARNRADEAVEMLRKRSEI